MMKITVENLSMRFAFRGIFKNLNINLAAPGSLAITGLNGSGKSTLLKIISGLLTPTSGKVTIEDESHILNSDEQKQVLAMVSPEMNLYDELSGIENLEFFMRAAGEDISRTKSEEALSKLGLAGRGDDYLRGYSSGMKMRLKYALAMLKEPDILLVDEPSTNLDAEGKKIVFDLMTEYKQEGILIFATNEEDEIGIAEQKIVLGR